MLSHSIRLQLEEDVIKHSNLLKSMKIFGLGVGPGNPTSEPSRKNVSVAVTLAPGGGKSAVTVSPAKVDACGWTFKDWGRA